MEQLFVRVAWLALTYVIGSLPFGLIIGRVFCAKDPRQHGSGNLGATNVARSCGKGWGAATLVLDAGKGFLPVAVAMTFSQSVFFLSLTALAAIMGHMFSMLLGWRGGKGVATTIGVFLALAPWPLFLALLVFAAVAWLSGHVSLASLALAGVLPLFLLLSGSFGLFLLSIVVMGLLFQSHRENILRLAAGQEHSWRGSTPS